MTRWHVACVLLIGLFGDICVSQCTWNLNKDLPFKDPVFFQRVGRNRGRLVIPTTAKGIQLAEAEKFGVFCPGNGNYIHQLGRHEADASCSKGSDVFVDGLEKTVKALECFKAVTGNVSIPGKSCAGDKGQVLSIGYNSPSGWLQLFDICYDHTRSIPLYAHHSIYGAAMGGAFVGNDRPGFKTNGLPSNVPISSAYKRKTQLRQFNKLVGTARANYYLNNTSFISRGHLAPDADFLLHSWQRSTYFYANVVPQWQNINGGNWGRLESSIRKAAITTKNIFNVWTGASGTLELTDENNNRVEMYLADKNRIPIPKYTWKVVCTVTKNCIAFVVFNNPFEKNNEVVCRNICKETNWHLEGFEIVSKGVITCCDVRDLSNTSITLPTLKVNDVLRL